MASRPSGANCKSRPKASQSALDYIFQGNPLKGWNLRPGDHGIIALLEAGSKTGEGHPDQWLGYLSQCGVQLDDPLVVVGKPYHVRDLLTQAQWDIYDGMEASWTLMAAITFLPLDEKWKAKDGSEWSIERIVKMEAGQPPGTGGCNDSHRMYALALAVKRYMKETGKTPLTQLTGGLARRPSAGPRRRRTRPKTIELRRRHDLDGIFRPPSLRRRHRLATCTQPGMCWNSSTSL